MPSIDVALSRFKGVLPLGHRSLVVTMARREVASKYRGSVLGVGWAVLYPLLILAAYTFVFRHVFGAKWPGASSDSSAEFALQIFAGLVIFNLFAEVMGRAPRLIIDHSNLVKQVRFPIELLAWVSLSSATFHGLMALVILMGAVQLLGNGLGAGILGVPVVILAVVPVLLGMAWMLSALGVFLRDIGHAMGPALNMLMFLSPVLYPSAADLGLSPTEGRLQR